MKNVSADIPLYLWESFIAVIEEKTLQRAASKTQTTQPTITRHLHQLEEALPLKLFELRGRTKFPTPFALELYKNINRRLRFIPDEIRSSVQNYGGSSQASLRVGGSSHALKRFVSTSTFKGQLFLEKISAERLPTFLKDETFDIVVSGSEVQHPAYQMKKIFNDEPVLLIPKKFARGKKIEDAKEWNSNSETYPLSIFHSQHPYFQEYRDHSKIDLQFSDWESLEKRAQAGVSWTVVPQSYAQESGSYLIVPLTGKLKKTTSFYLYFKKSLIKHAWFKEYLSQHFTK